METLDYLLNWTANKDATITCAGPHADVVVEVATHNTGMALETREFSTLGAARTWAAWRIK